MPGAAQLGVAVLIAVGAVWVAWLGFRPQVMGDYRADYAPAMNALLAGHLSAFFAHLPTNGAGGSVLLRAPAALLGKLLVGSQHAIFRFGAVSCELVAAAVGIALARDMRAAERTRAARATVVALFVLAPAVLDAILYGHPEEPLGAALCIAAVLLAARERPELAGIALGLAIINKPWGILALFPVLLAVRGRAAAVRVIAPTLTIAGAWTAAAYLGNPAHFGRTLLGASTSIVAHPVDLWWPLARIHHAPGVTPAYFPPRFVSDHARELAVLLSLPLAVLLARRRPRAPRCVESCLALLALLFLIRCALDPSNHVYYQVPFVLALAAWEARARGLPIFALLGLSGIWLTFHTVAASGSLTAQYLVYTLLAAGFAALLSAAAFGRGAGIVQPHDRHPIGRELPGHAAS